MRKLKMSNTNTITFEEGCNKYLENCRQRNLREGTINHYRQSYTQFYKYFAPETLITDMTEEAYRICKCNQRTGYCNVVAQF